MIAQDKHEEARFLVLWHVRIFKTLGGEVRLHIGDSLEIFERGILKRAAYRIAIGPFAWGTYGSFYDGECQKLKYKKDNMRKDARSGRCADHVLDHVVLK
jgi:hypothetical protein